RPVGASPQLPEAGPGRHDRPARPEVRGRPARDHQLRVEVARRGVAEARRARPVPAGEGVGSRRCRRRARARVSGRAPPTRSSCSRTSPRTSSRRARSRRRSPRPRRCARTPRSSSPRRRAAACISSASSWPACTTSRPPTSCSPRSLPATPTATAATCASSSSAPAPATPPPWRAWNWCSATSLFDTDPGPATVKLVVASDGTGSHGWADQPEVGTVEGVLTKAIERFLRHRPERLACAGRTDAGVHAWGQVVSFDADPGLDPWRLQSAVNGGLAPRGGVGAGAGGGAGVGRPPPACWRAYRYRVVNRPTPDPFLARYAWWVPAPLDVRAMRLGADPFVGEHDFAAFCRPGPQGSSTTRRVVESRWHDLGDGVLRYDVR